MTKTIEQQIADAVAAERERCAQIAEDQRDNIADAIRAEPRGNIKAEIMAGFDVAIDAIKNA